MAHTEGPWRVIPNEKIGVVNPSKRFIVAGEYADEGEPDLMVDVIAAHEDVDDDARLIAASPEMAALLADYEELEGEMILDDECWGNDSGLPTRYYDRLIELQARRNAVLKKAGMNYETRKAKS